MGKNESTLRVDLARLRELREAAGETQTDVAAVLGYQTRIGYSYLESGRCRLSAAQIALLAQHYGVPLESLFCGAEGTVTELTEPKSA
jgi:transcriptional regulator with XRE-family HTH domain